MTLKYIFLWYTLKVIIIAGSCCHNKKKDKATNISKIGIKKNTIQWSYLRLYFWMIIEIDHKLSILKALLETS